jgi:galactose mutarotase-like enzyme
LHTKISNSKLSVQIKSKGTELFSLKNKVTQREFIWEGNSDFWGKHSPVLFPIVGTLKNNTYRFENKEYQLPRHGFARDLEFKIVYQTENEVIFSLSSDENTAKLFPFKFELQMHYILIDATLKLSYSVKNLDNKTLPFSIGAHPAFALPFEFENYSLQFEHQETLKSCTLENDLLSDKTFEIKLENKNLPLSYSLFANDALIFKTLKSKFITIVETENPILKISFSDFENLGIWTKPNAKFICIEPWLGYSDTIHSNGNLSEKDGIQIVKENQTFCCSFSIEIL